MSESMVKLIQEISLGSDRMGTYHREFSDGPLGIKFAKLVARPSSGTEYFTTDSEVSEVFFQKVDFTCEGLTGIGSPENGEYGYESCGHWHTSGRK